MNAWKVISMKYIILKTNILISKHTINAISTILQFGYLCWINQFIPTKVIVQFSRAMEKYEQVKDIGYGNYAAVKLIQNKETKAIFAVKYISRGHKVYCSYFCYSFILFNYYYYYYLYFIICKLIICIYL